MSEIAAPARPAPDLVRILSGAPVAIAIVALALVQQSLVHLDGDDSWLITVAEKVSRGAVAYSDIQESNPPLAFLLYMPAVLLARVTPLRAEAWTVIEILVCLAGSLGLSARILRVGGALGDEERAFWRNAALFVFLLCPQFGFAQR